MKYLPWQQSNCRSGTAKRKTIKQTGMLLQSGTAKRKTIKQTGVLLQSGTAKRKTIK